MRVAVDVEETLRDMDRAFKVAPPDVAHNCQHMAGEIYEEYFAGRRSVGEFLCTLMFLLHKAANEIAWARETLQ